MSEPKFTGVWIPAGVFQTTMVSITAKVVYGVVDALDNEDGCFASNAYLSRHLGLGERQIRNILGELEEAKLIVRVEEGGRRVIRTVEKTALQYALTTAQVTKPEPVNEIGEAKNFLGGRKNISVGGGKKLPTYNKEDNKEDRDTKAMPWSSPLPFESEAFSKAWASWIDYRKEIKKPIKESTMKAQWKEFAKWGEQKAIIAIEQSITHGWQGIFEPARSQGGNTKPLTSKDHSDF
jgi:hypothetical protein